MANSRVQLHLIPGSQVTAVRRSDSGTSPVLGGDLSVVSVADIVQLLCVPGHSWLVQIVEQGCEASLTVCDGELVDARYGQRCGLHALVEMLAIRSGGFEVQPFEGTTTPTIRGTWQQNLLTAAHRLDERTNSGYPNEPRASSSLPPPPARHRSGPFEFGPDPNDSSDSTTEEPVADAGAAPEPARVARALALIDQGFAALRAGNVDETRAHWTAALELDPENRALQFNIKKLQSRQPRTERP